MAKRIKTVFTNDELPHKWAHKLQDYGRTGNGNFYFEGNTIYSYGSHFPIARHITNDKGKPAILFTTDSYGHTTGQHKTHVWRSIPEGTLVFDVPSVMPRDGSDNKLHKANVSYFQEQINDAYNEAQKGKKFKAYERLIRCHKFYNDGLKYVSFFGLTSTVNLPMPEEEFLNIVANARIDKNSYEDKAEARRIAKQEERARLLALTLPDKIIEWRSGRPTYGVDFSSIPTMLRIKGNKVETSLGAVVPIDDARKVLDLIKVVRTSGQPLTRGLSPIKVGGYPVNSIDNQGTLKAGCHTITWEEISKIIPELEKVEASNN